MKSFSSSDGCSIRGVPYIQASQPTKKFPRRAIEQLFCAVPNKLYGPYYGVQERKSQLKTMERKVKNYSGFHIHFHRDQTGRDEKAKV